MPFFPQLLSGASSQYPIRKRIKYRTIRNRCLDGRDVKLADPAASTIEWTLNFEELVDEEIATLRNFFVSVEGSLNSFTFLDPTDNLLAWSERFSESSWQKDPLIQLTSGAADPFDGSSAFRVANQAGASLRLRQTLNVPDGYCYALSVWARSDQADQVTLLRGRETATRNLSPKWSRHVFAASSSSSDETVEFGFEIAAGSSVYLFGAQVEPQIGASAYKKTTSRGGAYPMTRFVNDGLVLSTMGPGRHGCAVHLRSR